MSKKKTYVAKNATKLINVHNNNGVDTFPDNASDISDESNESNPAIVRWGTLGTSGAQWFNGITAEGKLQAAVWGGSILGDTEIDDGTWHHVAIVLPDKENVKVEDILLYVDGEQEDTTLSNGAQTIDTAVDMDVLISTDGSEGLLDDVRIYNYMLREDDIQALAQEGD